MLLSVSSSPFLIFIDRCDIFETSLLYKNGSFFADVFVLQERTFAIVFNNLVSSFISIFLFFLNKPFDNL